MEQGKAGRRAGAMPSESEAIPETAVLRRETAPRSRCLRVGHRVWNADNLIGVPPFPKHRQRDELRSERTTGFLRRTGSQIGARALFPFDSPVPCGIFPAAGWTATRGGNLQDQTAQAAEAKGSYPRAIALGVERLGLIPFRTPRLSLAIALALGVLAILGIERIKVDDSLSQLFRSNSPAFQEYEQVSREFPSSEYNVLVVVSGAKLLERESVEKLRSLVTDLQLIDGAHGVISMFSAREPSPNGGLPAPLFPENLPQGADYQRHVERVTSNELIRGKLLSDDGRLALIVLSLEPKIVDSDRLQATVADIQKTIDQDLEGAGLTAQLSGVPVMQLEIRRALERDRVLYNAVGFALGCGIAALFFRRLSLMIVAAGPPLIAIIFAL